MTAAAPPLSRRLGTSLGSTALATIVRVLQLTCRFDVIQGAETLEEVASRDGPVLLAFWHDRTLLASPILVWRIHRRGRSICVLTSRSQDGEIVVRTAGSFGIDAVRGSTSRGGVSALRVLGRRMATEGVSPVIVPDGPRGPAYQLQVGLPALARLSGAPAVLFGLAAGRYLRLRSWDRFVVPRPFTRIALAVSPLRTVDRRADVESVRGALERELTELTSLAEEAVGANDGVLAGARPPGG